MDLKKELDLAIESAKRAGDYLQGLGKVSIIKEEGKDIKLVADQEAEKIILDNLKNSDYGILTEESGRIGKEEPEIEWIIDPLDGSLNFARGMPNCVVSIALWSGSEPLLGVIYDFNRKEIFSGTRDSGVYLNGEKIGVSNIGVKNKAVICTGFPSHGDYSDEHLNSFVKKIQDFKKVRLLGSAALSLAYVAAGRADAYTEKGIMFWDVAAGLALVKFGGGEIKFEKMNKDQLDVYATNGLIEYG